MLSTIAHRFTVLLSLIAMTGILVHDTQVDNALSVISNSTSVRSADLNVNAVRLRATEQHIHNQGESYAAGTFSIKLAQPTALNKNDNEKKYIAQRRVMSNGFGNGYYWPSI